MRRILIEVGANDDLRIAFDKNLVSVEMKYIHQYCGGFKTNKITKAGSIKIYLLSLRSFFQFLLSKDEDHNVDIQLLTKADFQLKQRIRLYAKKAKLYSHQRKADDMEMLIDKCQVEKYETGKSHKKAEDLFAAVENGYKTPLNSTEYCIMRDCLFPIIALGCAQRPGVSVNMKVKEFLRAKQLDNNHFEIEVWDHKTVLYHGAFGTIKQFFIMVHALF